MIYHRIPYTIPCICMFYMLLAFSEYFHIFACGASILFIFYQYLKVFLNSRLRRLNFICILSIFTKSWPAAPRFHLYLSSILKVFAIRRLRRLGLLVFISTFIIFPKYPPAAPRFSLFLLVFLKYLLISPAAHQIHLYLLVLYNISRIPPAAPPFYLYIISILLVF